MIYLLANPTTWGSFMSTPPTAHKMQWQFMPSLATPAVHALAQSCHITPFLAQIIASRGYTEPSTVSDYLGHVAPNHDPLAMHDMRIAAQRIIRAITEAQPIAVYGDFDADGITATSLICDAFRQLGANIAPYIPHRTNEGYGLNHDAIERLWRSGVQVLLTVDCGISNREEVAHARALGLDVIVTDHHHPPAELPVATAVVNPHLPFCHYPDKGLVGVGVAYKLVAAIGALGMPLPTHAMTDLLDLVALGTIADLGPLHGENRAYVQSGLAVMARGQRPGIAALLEVSGVAPAELRAEDVAFRLAPRINAAGRIYDAEPAYRLLLADSVSDAQTWARQLDQFNSDRQQQTRALQERIATDIQAINRHLDPVIVHADPDAHAGLVGLVAARIADQFARPTIIIEHKIPHARGSARSANMIDMIGALRNCGVPFLQVGGHAAAAGFHIESANIDALRAALITYAGQHQLPIGVRTLTIDCEVPATAIDMQLYAELAALEPTGQRNPAPVLLTRNCRVISAKTMGADGRHLMLKLDLAGRAFSAVAWHDGALAVHFNRITHVDIAYQMHLNVWNGRQELRLDLRDFRSARGADAPPHLVSTATLDHHT